MHCLGPEDHFEKICFYEKKFEFFFLRVLAQIFGLFAKIFSQ